MENSDDIVAWLAAGVLRSGDYEIEASTLEAIAQDAETGSLDEALMQASVSERRGGAFGMDIAGTILIPVLIAVARQFWEAYQKEFVKKLGVSAAEATIAQVKRWFGRASAEDTQAMSEGLAATIRKVGSERGLAPTDIEALVAAVLSGQLAPALIVN